MFFVFLNQSAGLYTLGDLVVFIVYVKQTAVTVLARLFLFAN